MSAWTVRGQAEKSASKLDGMTPLMAGALTFRSSVRRFAPGGYVGKRCRVRIRKDTTSGHPAAAGWPWLAECDVHQDVWRGAAYCWTWAEAMAWADRHVRGQG